MLRVRIHELVRLLDEHTRRAVGEFGLTLAQGNALRDLGEPLTTRELADKLVCEPSNATFVVDKLENAGLVRREPHPTDRRVRYIVLTPAGVDLRRSLLASAERNEPLAHLSDEEIGDLEHKIERALGAGSIGLDTADAVGSQHFHPFRGGSNES